jgi:hypothetical protein
LNDRAKEDEMGMACSTHEKKRNACRILVGMPQGKGPLGRSNRWVDIIKMDLREDGVVWTGSIWLRIGNSGGLFMNTIMSLRVP